MIPREGVSRLFGKHGGVVCSHFPIASSVPLLNLMGKNACVTELSFSEVGVGGVLLVFDAQEEDT